MQLINRHSWKLSKTLIKIFFHLELYKCLASLFLEYKFDKFQQNYSIICRYVLFVLVLHCKSVYLSICLSVYLSICLSVYLSIYTWNSPNHSGWLWCSVARTHVFKNTSVTINQNIHWKKIKYLIFVFIIYHHDSIYKFCLLPNYTKICKLTHTYILLHTLVYMIWNTTAVSGGKVRKKTTYVVINSLLLVLIWKKSGFLKAFYDKYNTLKQSIKKKIEFFDYLLCNFVLIRRIFSLF